MIFKKIAVIPNKIKDPQLENTKKLIAFFKEKKTSVCFSDEFCGFMDEFENISYIRNSDIYGIADLVIVLGGDGTILREAAPAAKNRVPIIGLNLGRLGYMCEIEMSELNLLDNLYSGNFNIENRMMLDINVINKNGEYIKNLTALNDAVITNGIVSKIIEIELLYDSKLITNYKADGVIVATPTGSTAHSLSAGGPIITPTTECFCVTPICPHTLINRPFVLSAEPIIEIKNINSREKEVYLTADGNENVRLDYFDTVKIRKSNHYLKLITIRTNSFFDILRGKISEKF